MITKAMKFSLVAGLFLVTSIAYAAYPSDYFGVPPKTTSGFYINGQVGYGQQNLDSDTLRDPLTGDTFNVKGSSGDGVAGRLAVGYDINDYLGIELGGAAWSNADYKWRESPSGVTGSGKSQSYAIDLLGKFNVPLWKGFHVFVKGGGAYVISDKDLSGTSSITNPTLRMLVQNDKDNSVRKLRPEVAAGIGYLINQHLDLSLNYTRIFGSGGSILSSSEVPTLEMATIGLQWNI